MEITREVNNILVEAYEVAKKNKHELITVEHILYAITFQERFIDVIEELKGNIDELRSNLMEYLNNYIDKDENGNISFPEGYFSYTVSELDNRVDYDYYNGYIYGEGEIVLDYKIDDNVDIKEINIEAFTDQWGYQYGLNGDYYIYNYNTNQYEEFKLTSGSYKVINDGSYSLDNIIKIKVVASENRDNAAPKLRIKGVEK